MSWERVRFYNRRILFSQGAVAFQDDCCCNKIREYWGRRFYPSDAPTPVHIEFPMEPPYEITCSYEWGELDYLSPAFSAEVYDSYTDEEGWGMCPGFTYYSWYPSFNGVRQSWFPNYNRQLLYFRREDGTYFYPLVEYGMAGDLIDTTKGMYVFDETSYADSVITQPEAISYGSGADLPWVYGYRFSLKCSMDVNFVFCLPSSSNNYTDGVLRISAQDDGAWLNVDGNQIMSLLHPNIWRDDEGETVPPLILNPSHTYDVINDDGVITSRYNFLVIPKSAGDSILIESAALNWYDYKNFWSWRLFGGGVGIYPTHDTPANWQDLIEFEVTDEG